MAYTINLTDGTIFAVVADGTINTASSVTLVGKNYAGYGEFLDENFIHMLENFSDGTAPTAPLTGQLWYDSTNSRLSVFRGEYWKTISGASAVAYPGPQGNIVGDLWWDTTNDQLKTWSGTDGGNVWKIAGPVYTRSQGVTGAFPIDITDIASVPHVVTGIYAAGTLVSITNTDAAFIPQAPYVSSFPQIYTGTTVRSNSFMSGNIVNSANLYISAAGASNVVIVTSTGINVAGYVTATSTITGGNIATGGYVTATGNITGGNVLTSGIVSAAGNVIGGNFNTTGAISATGNITGGNINTGGSVSAIGNVVGGNLNGVGLSLSGNVLSAINTTYNIQTSGNVIGTYLTGTITTNAQPNITSIGVLSSLSVAGTTTTGNLITGGVVSAAGNIYGVNVLATNLISSSGNVVANNLIATTVQILDNGPLEVNSITHVGTNATGNIGSASSYFNRIFATATSALYADVAERFAADEVLSPGTVVELGGVNEITRAKAELTETVFGVISTRPAYTMNGGAGDDDTHPAVAMTGRVPVQVIGQIRKGDRLVSAGEGKARAAAPGEATSFNVIGRSLVDKLSDGPGTVEAIVTIK